MGATWSTHTEHNRFHFVGNLEWKLVAMWAV